MQCIALDGRAIQSKEIRDLTHKEHPSRIFDKPAMDFLVRADAAYSVVSMYPGECGVDFFGEAR